MSDLFLSYQRDYSVFAHRLIDHLHGRGKDAWVDWEGIPFSAPNWWQEIQAGIEGAHNFIFILTPKSMASIVCNMELDYAFELKKRIIIIEHERVVSHHAFATIADYKPDAAMEERLNKKDPLLMTRDNWRRLNHINWLIFHDEDNFNLNFEKLIETIETDLEYVKSHTRYLIRSKEWIAAQRRADLLLFGKEIDKAEEWLKRAEIYIRDAEKVSNQPLEDLHVAYIRSSRQADIQRRRQVRAARLAIIVLIVALVVASIVGSAIVQQTQAESEIIRATSNQSLRVAATEISGYTTQVSDAEQRSEDALSNVANANATLTQVPLTLTSVMEEVFQVEDRLSYAESLRLAAYAEILMATGGNVESSALLSIRSLSSSYTTQADIVLQQALNELYSLQLYTGGGSIVAYAPDGQHFVTDNPTAFTVELRAIADGALVRSFSGHTDLIYSLTFSADGLRLLTGSRDNTAILWDVQSGTQLYTFEAHSRTINAVAIANDDSVIAVGSEDGKVSLWDMDGLQLALLDTAASGAVFDLAFSPDNLYLVVGVGGTLSPGNAGEAQIWEVETVQRIARLNNFSSFLYSVAYSPDGNTIAIGHGSGRITLFDARTHAIIAILDDGETEVSSLTYSPDGTTLLSGHWNGIARLLDAGTGELLREFKAHTATVVGQVYTDDRATTGAIARSIRNNENLAFTVSYAPDGRSMLTANGADQTVRRWTLESAVRVNSGLVNASNPLPEQLASVNAIAYSPDGSAIATGSIDGEVHVWDIATGTLLQSMLGHDNDITSLVYSPDGSMLMSGSKDGTAELWNVDTGDILRIFAEHLAAVSAVDFAPDGRTILIADANGIVHVYVVASGTVLLTIDTGFPNIVASYSHDGETIFTSGYAYEGYNIVSAAQLWDAATGVLTLTIPDVGRGKSILSPDSRRILTDESDTAVLWDAETGESIKSFTLFSITGTAYSNDGATIILGSNDRTATLIDVETGEALRVFPHESAVSHLAYSPDDSVIASVSDGKLRLSSIDLRNLIIYTCDWLFRELTETEHREYNIDMAVPTCSESASQAIVDSITILSSVSTSTPLPVWTAIATPTSLPPSPTLVPSPTFKPNVFDTTVGSRTVIPENVSLILPEGWEIYRRDDDDGLYFSPGQLSIRLYTLVASPSEIYRILGFNEEFSSLTQAMNRLAILYSASNDFETSDVMESTIGPFEALRYEILMLQQNQFLEIRIAELPNGQMLLVFVYTSSELKDIAMPMMHFMIDSITLEGTSPDFEPTSTP